MAKIDTFHHGTFGNRPPENLTAGHPKKNKIVREKNWKFPKMLKHPIVRFQPCSAFGFGECIDFDV